MGFSLIPDRVFSSVAEIRPEWLTARGITLLLADLDNTLVPYKVEEPAAEVAAWARELRDHGIQLFLLSNSRKPGRAQQFAQSVGIPYQGHSGKPKRSGYLKAMERMGCTPGQTVMVGDQIFADRMAAGLYGCPCLYLLPRTPRDRNKFVRLKRKYEPYWLDRYYQKGGRLYV